MIYEFLECLPVWIISFWFCLSDPKYRCLNLLTKPHVIRSLWNQQTVRVRWRLTRSKALCRSFMLSFCYFLTSLLSKQSKSPRTDVSLNIKEIINLPEKRKDLASWENSKNVGILLWVLYQQWKHLKKRLFLSSFIAGEFTCSQIKEELNNGLENN